jgi:hypothetical protein
MIHAADLSSIVKRLIYDPPDDVEYINAIDFAANRSQAKLITTISEAMGGLEVNQLTYLDAIFQDDYNIQTLNVCLVPTDLLLSQAEAVESTEKNRTYAEGERRSGITQANSSRGNTARACATTSTTSTKNSRPSGT